MAPFESSNSIEKKLLKNSSIEISGVRCEIEQTYRLATLVIGKFYQLKHDIEYVTPLLHLDGELCFIKQRNQHIIKISAKDVGKLSASVLYENIRTSPPVSAQQSTEGEYVIVFPSSAVENPQNTFLKEGKLLIHIKFQESERVLKRMHACNDRRDKYSAERLVEDLKSLYVYPHHTDVILHVDKQKICVPKGLLAARSEYFKEYPDAENSIHLCTYYETVSCVVQYLYTGEIPNIEKLHEQEVCRIIEVASSLKIKSLMSKCLSYMNQLIIQGAAETQGVVSEKCVTS